MKAKIVLATVSGKAYYMLVKELKEKGLPFLSLKPWDPIPLDAKVVVTTKEEKPSITHPNVLTFSDWEDPARVIDEAGRVVQGKQSYEKIMIGIDPGKTFGVAVIGDGKVLETANCRSLGETIGAVLDAVHNVPATDYVLKVGDGVPLYTKELLQALDDSLPERVTIQTVHEAGTSHFVGAASHRRGAKDAMSAVRIAGRNGKGFPREKTT
jgi:hypothetical protein